MVGDPGRPRSGGGARHHPLAVAQLLRLLQRQHVRPGRDRRPRGRRPRRPGDALVDRPGLHGGGDARARLAGRAPGSPGALPVERSRRRLDPGRRVRGQPLCPLGRPRAGRGSGAPRRPGRLHVERGALLGREGSPRRRLPARSTAVGAGRPGHPGDAPRPPAGLHRGGRGCRAGPVLRVRHRRHHLHPRHRPGRRDRGGRPSGGGVAARRRRPRGRRSGLPRAPLDPPGPRAGGQLLHGPAQVALHRDGVRRVLGRRPRAADQRARASPPNTFATRRATRAR